MQLISALMVYILCSHGLHFRQGSSYACMDTTCSLVTVFYDAVCYLYYLCISSLYNVICLHLLSIDPHRANCMWL